ncbi:MAG: bifunctional diaminohydroxyphosphoribosylaminopyrimidine deaminase/5-amino-6-(5-phosphoribosylamino)uracil reductase RibD [Bacteroidetes bacterium]|nr:MAG: bifunctional diaminohydroxyphosphoribosylaminopyrimidine deaminase/5-amino-6-(5-phosphoribosylamino)uracil reductase RibD [Bacteroidota bacterium]PTM11868.1 MAG: bifunctional diaminohydroxyphosphoribosylaminopyrimidine deaminase/5-amino-6-(5-phosphoribosylamino)uracil reductase RibD [Bacteroidota bacterium]
MSLNFNLMRRCFDLARLGSGSVSPNPLVGAVLAHGDKIIGEGFYATDGGPHAEVRALASVKPADRPLIRESTLYISLEPCNIYGRTPPCTDLILREGIPRVVVAGTDLTPGVNGSGLYRLRAQGVIVETGVLAAEGAHLSNYRNVYVSQSRPYVLLKYAQTHNNLIAPADPGPYWLTNDYSRRLVHKWRTATDAILVGAGTARADNPALTTRYFPGPQPLRMVLDRKGNLPPHLQLFDGQHPTVVFTENPRTESKNLRFVTHDFSAVDWLPALLHKIADLRIAHLTVEGGAWLLEQFISQAYWDEARVFTTPQVWHAGKAAPVLHVEPVFATHLLADQLQVYHPAVAGARSC